MTRRSASRYGARRIFRQMTHLGYGVRLPIAGLAFLVTTAAAFAEEGDLGASIAERMKEIFNFNRAAVVKIQSSDQHGRIEGTGFYADPSGTIYTVTDVIGDGKDITVCQGMRKMPAHLL